MLRVSSTAAEKWRDYGYELMREVKGKLAHWSHVDARPDALPPYFPGQHFFDESEPDPMQCACTPYCVRPAVPDFLGGTEYCADCGPQKCYCSCFSTELSRTCATEDPNFGAFTKRQLRSLERYRSRGKDLLPIPAIQLDILGGGGIITHAGEGGLEPKRR